MNLASLVEAHGYWVLTVGCLLEGETILVLAGFAAHQGYLNPLAVIAVAALAGFVGDQFYFWLGRRHGHAVMARWPSVVAHNDRLQALVGRYHAAVIVGVRFAYGLRIAGPILIGMSPVSSYRFALLNAMGAMLWACLIGGIGWVFGHAAESLMGEVRSAEVWLVLALAGIGFVIWWIRRSRGH